MDVRNLRLELASTILGDKQMYFIILANKKLFDNIVFAHEGIREKWVQCLARWCTLGGYSKYYRDGDSLGQGNYGTVRACYSVSEPSEYILAVKIYDKGKYGKRESKVNTQIT